MHFIVAFAALLIAILAPIVAVNLSVDVTGVYSSNKANELALARTYAEALINSPGGLLWEPRERAVKIEYAKLSTADCFVTGSSREMQIDPTTLPALAPLCPTLANVSTSGAGIEDFLTILGLVVAKGRPATMIVGIAPWSLRYNADKGWQQFPDVYGEQRARLGLDAGTARDWTRAKLALENLLSFAYFRRNLDWMRARGSFRAIPVDPDEARWRDDETALRPNGVLAPSRQARAEPPPPDVAIGVRDPRVGTPLVSPETLADLDRAIGFARAKGIRFAFVLPPFHPRVLGCQSKEFCAAIVAVRAAIRALAVRHASPVFGDFDPACCGVTRDDFYDYTHLRPSGLRKITLQTGPSRL